MLPDHPTTWRLARIRRWRGAFGGSKRMFEGLKISPTVSSMGARLCEGNPITQGGRKSVWDNGLGALTRTARPGPMKR